MDTCTDSWHSSVATQKESKRFCLRAQGWPGHTHDEHPEWPKHKFVSLEELLRIYAEIKSGKYPFARPSPDLDADETWQGIEKVYENASGGAPAGWEQNPQSEASSGAEDTRPPLRNEPLAAVLQDASTRFICDHGEFPFPCPYCQGPYGIKQAEAIPDKCPTCGSNERHLRAEIWVPCTECETQPCTDSWHSSVATQKESK